MDEALITEKLTIKMKEYEEQHKPWVEVKHGNTYVGYNIQDYITEGGMTYIRKLLRLMHLDFYISYPINDDKKYYLIIEGEDKARADYIQKFIDNGYRLTWD